MVNQPNKVLYAFHIHFYMQKLTVTVPHLTALIKTAHLMCFGESSVFQVRFCVLFESNTSLNK